MRILCIVILSSLTLGAVYGQGTTENIWQSLARITYTKQYDELLGFKVDVPVFSEEVKALEGKEVEIKGYVIPVEGYKSHTEFIFSAFPYNMSLFPVYAST